MKLRTRNIIPWMKISLKIKESKVGFLVKSVLGEKGREKSELETGGVM